MASESANGQNGNSVAQGKKSSRLRNVVNYDEKQHMAEIEEDIQHGVAHTNMSELEERVADLNSDNWESESLFEDAISGLADDGIITDGESFVIFALNSPSAIFAP